MNGHENLIGAVGAVAEGAAEALRRMSENGSLGDDTRSARELCAVLKDALAVERELRAEERAAVVTVRFEGDAEEASV